MISDYDTGENSVVGKHAILPPGQYELTSYTEEGPAHSEEWVECDQEVRGLVVANAYETLNVAVQNEEGKHLIIIAPAHKVEVV